MFVRQVQVTANLTRPADTNGYALRDTVAASPASYLTFENCARNLGGGGRIVAAQLETSDQAEVARFRLHLFNAPPTVQNDNAPYRILSGDRTKRVCKPVTFPACATEAGSSTGAVAENDSLDIPFICATGDDNLYGILQTLDAKATGISAQVYYITLYILQMN